MGTRDFLHEALELEVESLMDTAGRMIVGVQQLRSWTIRHGLGRSLRIEILWLGSFGVEPTLVTGLSSLMDYRLEHGFEMLRACTVTVLCRGRSSRPEMTWPYLKQQILHRFAQTSRQHGKTMVLW